jgi:sterol desaturase/sphingolipid hydroxylase (fatty acid hydroxylase superfamily)
MDDSAHGTRDRRGHYRPNGALQIAPVYRWPPRLAEVLAWLPGYFLPWNLAFAASAVLWWAVVLPERAVMQSLAPGWILWLLAVNAGAVALFYGAFELRLYIRRAQGARFKYNPAFPADRPARSFLFGRQDRDNIARTFLSGVPIWTGVQVLVLWAWANGWGNWIGLDESPVYLVLVALLIPALHEFHFYCIHRLIHVPWLYRHVHAVHHKAVNPSPWSSLAMHPLEHLLYFSSMAYHLVLPSHPLLALYQLHFAGFGAIPGHVGFDKVELGEARAMDTHAYTHYLHHKYFEVNYGDGLIPFDKLFGTWHDGTEAGDAGMRDRLARMSHARRSTPCPP